VIGGIRGGLGCTLYQKRLRTSWKLVEGKPLPDIPVAVFPCMSFWR